MPAERLARWLAGFTERHGETRYSVTGNGAGTSVVALVGTADQARAWVQVPFPPLATTEQSDAELKTALIAQVERPRTVGALLVRRGGYAAGVFSGSTLTSSKVGSSYVQGTTKAGGWSQQRYARRRDNQATAAFAEAADQAVRILLPAAAKIEALFCGGDRKAVDATLADERLAVLRPLVAKVFFAVPDPRLRVLQALPEQFLAVRIQLDP